MKEISLLNEYAAWLIRNSFKESGLNGRSFDCDIFSIIINPHNLGISSNGFPDTITGLQVFCDEQMCSEFLLRLAVKPEDMERDARKFIKAFYDLQSLYDFYHNDTWKKECGIL